MYYLFYKFDSFTESYIGFGDYLLTAIVSLFVAGVLCVPILLAGRKLDNSGRLNGSPFEKQLPVFGKLVCVVRHLPAAQNICNGSFPVGKVFFRRLQVVNYATLASQIESTEFFRQEIERL